MVSEISAYDSLDIFFQACDEAGGGKHVEEEVAN
jgi:hypothetical protein